MKLLKHYELDQATYNDILDYYTKLEEGAFLKSGSYDEFKYGYQDKLTVMVDKNRECFCINIYNLEDYGIKCKYRFDKYHYQVVIQCNNNENFINDIKDLSEAYTPHQAVSAMNKMLSKYYTKQEIDERLDMFTQEEWVPQLHTTVYDTLSKYYGTDDTEIMENEIHLYNNCYYYDINGAHTYLLSMIFPKAEADLRYWNDHKKEAGKEYFKKIPNYYVGCLGMASSKHKGTYRWIVNQVNKIMENVICYLNPREIVYVNTDGLIVQDPSKILQTSTELGKFKLESVGDVYIYKNSHYDIIEYEKLNGEIKRTGSLLNKLKPMVSLREGKVIDYLSVTNRTTNVKSITNIKELKKYVKIHS